jgi:peptidoglycan/LPS O-acetylase OafA/YrhL
MAEYSRKSYTIYILHLSIIGVILSYIVRMNMNSHIKAILAIISINIVSYFVNALFLYLKDKVRQLSSR